MRVPSLPSSRFVPWRWLLGLPGRRAPVCVCALHAARLVGCASGEAAGLQLHYSKANGVAPLPLLFTPSRDSR